MVLLRETKVRLFNILLGRIFGNFEGLVQLFRFGGLSTTVWTPSGGSSTTTAKSAPAGKVLKRNAAKH